MDGKQSADQIINDARIAWGGWAISKLLAVELTKRLEKIRPRKILELGSGSSTAILADYAARYQAKVISLEHEGRFYERTRKLLKEIGLADSVELRLAPLTLVSFCGLRYAWYSSKLIDKFEFVFADGPPIVYGRQAILFAISDQLDINWELWLDDGNRDHEKECIKLWKRHYEFVSTLYNVDHKGVWILKSKPNSMSIIRTDSKTS